MDLRLPDSWQKVSNFSEQYAVNRMVGGFMQNKISPAPGRLDVLLEIGEINPPPDVARRINGFGLG